MRHLLVKFVFLARTAIMFISLMPMACSAAPARARISGVYVAHDSGGTVMLNVTQTNNGQLTGVIDSVVLDSDGEIKASHSPIAGVVDSGHLTLSIGGEFFGLFKTTLSGIAREHSIALSIMDWKGNVQGFTLVSSSEAQFKSYADGLRARSVTIIFNDKLSKFMQSSEEILRDAETWHSGAQSRLEQLRSLEDKYSQIENRMSSLVHDEAQLNNRVKRYNTSVAVYDDDVAGYNLDVQTNSTWDYDILYQAKSLKSSFAELAQGCATPETTLKRRGATEVLLSKWRENCKQVLAQNATFEPELAEVTQKRAALAVFQTDAKKRRTALLNEAHSLIQ